MDEIGRIIDADANILLSKLEGPLFRRWFLEHPHSVGETYWQHFGMAAGFSYTAALYYALVAENASVDAGGAHESLIGIGIGLGPLSGLAGQLLIGAKVPFSDADGLGHFVALTLTTLPIIAVCTTGSPRSLFRLRGRPA